MGAVTELINKNNEKIAGKKKRKTKNNELFIKSLIALSQDDDYVIKRVKELDDSGKLITEDHKPSEGFKKFIVNVYQHAGLSTAEAKEFAASFIMSMDNAEKIRDLVFDAVLVNVDDLQKKVQIINTPELNATLSLVDAPETVRSNPKDKTKKTKIKAHKRIKVEQQLYAFQKETIN